jgi:hypothetical protein
MRFDLRKEGFKNYRNNAFLRKFIKKQLYVLLLGRIQHPAVNGYLQNVFFVVKAYKFTGY